MINRGQQNAFLCSMTFPMPMSSLRLFIVYEAKNNYIQTSLQWRKTNQYAYDKSISSACIIAEDISFVSWPNQLSIISFFHVQIESWLEKVSTNAKKAFFYLKDWISSK